MNQGKPYANWDVEVLGPEGDILATLKPGMEIVETLWHDGRAITVREKINAE